MKQQIFVTRRAHALCEEGQAAHQRGEFERAITLYTRSLGVYPTAEAYTFRGWAYSMTGRSEEAIEECKRAIAVDPTFGNPYNDIGAYLLQNNLLDEAIPWFELAKTAQRYEPRHFPYMNLARIYSAKGLIQKAVAEYQGALHFKPDDPFCLAALSELRDQLN